MRRSALTPPNRTPSSTNQTPPTPPHSRLYSHMYQGHMYLGYMYQGHMYQGHMYQGHMYQGYMYQK